MVRKNDNGVAQFFCDNCDELIVGVAWGTPGPEPRIYCTTVCRDKKEKEMDMTAKKAGSKAAAKPASKRSGAKDAAAKSSTAKSAAGGFSRPKSGEPQPGVKPTAVAGLAKREPFPVDRPEMKPAATKAPAAAKPKRAVGVPPGTLCNVCIRNAVVQKDKKFWCRRHMDRQYSKYKTQNDTPVPGNLPSKSPYKDKHQSELYQILRRSKTVGAFRAAVKDKGLYKDSTDARFSNTLYALVRKYQRELDSAAAAKPKKKAKPKPKSKKKAAAKKRAKPKAPAAKKPAAEKLAG